MVIRTFNKEQTVRNVNAEPKLPACELTEEELDRVSGGISRIGTKEVSPSLSLGYAALQWAYIPTEPC